MNVFPLNFLKAYCRIAIQENLVRPEECADRNVTKFSKGKCEVLHLRRKNNAAAQQAGPWLPGMQLCRKGCGVLLLSEAGHEPGVCPGIKEGHQHPRLYWQDGSQ